MTIRWRSARSATGISRFRRAPRYSRPHSVTGVTTDGRHSGDDGNPMIHARGTLVRHTQPSIRRRGRRVAAVAIGFVLIAAACSDKKDDESVGGADSTTPATDDTGRRRRPTTTAPATTAAEGDDTATTGGRRTPRRRPRPAPTTTPPSSPTLPAPDDGPGHRRHASSSPARPRSAPRGRPPRCSATRTASMRIRTFIEPLFVTGDDLQVHGFLGREHRAQRGLHRVDDQGPRGHHVHRRHAAQRRRRDRQPQPHGRRPPRRRAPTARTWPRTPTGRSSPRSSTTTRSRITTGKNGDPDEPVPWPLFPYLLTGQPGFIASPTWLAAVDGDPDLADPARRHRPVHRHRATCPVTA